MIFQETHWNRARAPHTITYSMYYNLLNMYWAMLVWACWLYDLQLYMLFQFNCIYLHFAYYPIIKCWLPFFGHKSETDGASAPTKRTFARLVSFIDNLQFKFSECFGDFFSLTHASVRGHFVPHFINFQAKKKLFWKWHAGRAFSMKLNYWWGYNMPRLVTSIIITVQNELKYVQQRIDQMPCLVHAITDTRTERK